MMIYRLVWRAFFGRRQPRVVSPPTITIVRMPYVKTCPDCQVQWAPHAGDECWMCGKTIVESRVTYRPLPSVHDYRPTPDDAPTSASVSSMWE